MNIDKSKQRIAKRVKKGFQGYPQIELAYYGQTLDIATQVIIKYTLEEGAVAQEQQFSCSADVRLDETIQTTLLKIIERADVKTVIESTEVSNIS